MTFLPDWQIVGAVLVLLGLFVDFEVKLLHNEAKEEIVNTQRNN